MASEATEEGEIDSGVSECAPSLGRGCLTEGDRDETLRTGSDAKAAEFFFESHRVDLFLGQEYDARCSITSLVDPAGVVEAVGNQGDR